MSFWTLLLGRRLANREQPGRKIGVFEGVPTLGLDGLGSCAYGPEAALTILAPAGLAGLAAIGPLMAAIVALLVVLYASYWQTIIAYPNNGGAYVVSKDNLGTDASLLAAAALMIDYVLNVAVGISAGVGALVSAVPQLQPYILELCLGVLALITVLNLRGTMEAGRVFAVPTYLFVACFLFVIGLGAARTIAAGGHPLPVVAPPQAPAAVEGVSLWLLIRAFASGCTAMTGVEAVSNGVDAFRPPVVRRAHRTLTAIVGVLAVLLAGVAFLAGRYGIVAMDQTRPGYQSVLSQLVAAVAGKGPLYDVAMASLLCVLALSANTSFAGFPRLCRAVAEDGFLPRPFAAVGRRLVFSVGILYLAATTGLLLVAFGGITDRLIPLFAIGAFLTFTLSQAGMVAHWRKALRRESGRERLSMRAHLVINSAGAVATAAALAIIVVAKFAAGAWITLLAIPAVIVLLKTVRSYYDQLDAAVRKRGPLSLSHAAPPIVLVVTRTWNRVTDEALRFAMRLSPDVHAVHLTELGGPGDNDEAAMRQRWAEEVEAPARTAGLRPPRLLLIRADYRLIHEPLLKLVMDLEDAAPGRLVAVLLPELVMTRWWQHLLHNNRARALRSRLLRYGGSRLVVIEMPWYLREPRIDEAIDADRCRIPAVPVD